MTYQLIITGIAFLILGWLLGSNHANKKLSDIEDAIDFIDEANSTLSVENIQYFNAANEIELLKKIESGDTTTAAQHLIDSLGPYYKMSSEAADDNMASDQEIEIVKTIENLAKHSNLFKKVTEYQE